MRIGVMVAGLAIALATAPGSGPSPTATVRDLIAAGRYAEAEAAAREELTRAEAAAGPESVRTAEAIDLLVEASCRGFRGMGPGIRELAERAVRIKDRTRGPEDPATASSLSLLSQVLRQSTDYPAAREAARRALEIRERALGPESLETASSLIDLAYTFHDAGDLASARPLLERALAIRERLLPPDHPDLAAGLHHLGILLRNSGALSAAIGLQRRALAIREKTLPADHPDLGITLGNLGALLYATGDYAGARALYERALVIREKAFGQVHPRVAETLANLADILRDSGDYDEARPLYERALSIMETTLGPEHPYTALSCHGLALLNLWSGAPEEAESLLRRALQIWEKRAGPGHPLVAAELQALGDMMREKGSHAEARTLLERALAVRRKALAANQPEIALSLTSLGHLMRDTGDLSGALGMYEQARQLRVHSLGAGHPHAAESLVDLASAHWLAGDSAAALARALQAEPALRDHLVRTARSLSGREALLYEKMRLSGLDVALSVLAAGGNPASQPGAVEAVWTEVIRSRALVLDEMASRHRSLFELEEPSLAPLLEEVESATEQYTRLLVRGQPGERVDRFRADLDESRDAMEKAERALAERSGLFRRRREQAQAGMTEVASALPERSALVAYALYERHEPASGRGEPGAPRRVASYLALVAGGSGGPPRAVPLGPARILDGAIADWRRQAASQDGVPSLASYRDSGRRLREMLWDPLAVHLKGAGTVFVVPDGAIHTINFASLPLGQERFLLEDGPLIHYLSAERDLLRPAGKGPRAEGLLVVGGPDFDAGASPQDAGREPRPERASDCTGWRSLAFSPLPGSRFEAEEVEQIWLRSESSVVKLTGRAASEQAFKTNAPGRRTLHLATHGFFLQGSCGDRAANPLQLSGLALSGANRRRWAAGSGEDGILTAEEIAALDLRGVEWAVLSACESGLGEVQSGEGVLGLRRAFQVAGAGTLVLTLWPVSDHDARDWVRALYTARMSGLPTAQAVRRAALSLLHERRRGGRSVHPHSWGAFVATGDWR